LIWISVALPHCSIRRSILLQAATRRLELRIEELTREVEEAKKTTEAFDEEVVREVQDFERIKRIEFKTQFGALADAHVEFYGKGIEVWEKYVQEMEGLGAPIA